MRVMFKEKGSDDVRVIEADIIVRKNNDTVIRNSVAGYDVIIGPLLNDEHDKIIKGLFHDGKVDVTEYESDTMVVRRINL